MGEVFIERASPLTKNGIASMGCTEEEYNWYCKGLQDGRNKEIESLQEIIKTGKERYWHDAVESVCLSRLSSLTGRES